MQQCKLHCHGLLTCLAFICFYNALDNELVHDDIFAITNNMDLRPETPFVNLFYNDFWGRSIKDNKSHKSYRPLTILTFRLNYMIHNLQPFGYHLVNVVLHMVVVNVFFYALYKYIFRGVRSSLFAALIFTTHPVHVEAVTGVVGRADVLSCLFFLLCFIFFIRYSEERKFKNRCSSIFFCLALLFGTICLFVKEHSAMVFFVCILYNMINNKKNLQRDFLELYSGKKNKEFIRNISNKTKDMLKENILLLTWVTILFGLRIIIMGSELPKFQIEDNPASFSPYLTTRIMTYIYLLVFNCQLFLIPYTLCYDWQGSSIPLVESISDYRNLQTLMFFVILTSLFWKNIIDCSKCSKIVLVGFILLWIPFIPASNIFLRVGFVVAERILYISSLGFCILVAYGLDVLIVFFKNKKLLYTLFSGQILLYSIKTITYNKVWKSRESLFRSGINTLPHNAKVHYNFANFLKDTNNTEEAIQHYQNAVRLDPSHSSAHNNLATIINNDEIAEYHLMEALKYTPGHYRAMVNLALLYRKKKDYNRCEDMLRRCLSFKPDYMDALILFGEILYQSKKVSEALMFYENLPETYASNLNIQRGYANVLGGSGIIEKAFEKYDSILRVSPKSYDIYHDYSNLLELNGFHKRAVDLLERAISIDESKPDAYHLLAVMYYKRKDFFSSKNVYQRLFKLSKPSAEHFKNYAIVLFELNEFDKAIKVLRELVQKFPLFLEGYYTLINFLHKTGKKSEVEETVDMALSYFPEDHQILLQKASSKREVKDYIQAKNIYHSILAKTSNNFDALLNLAIVLHIEGNYEEAIGYYEKAKEIRPRDPIVMENISRVKRLLLKTV
ncbi:protein O-mannosyl-transferase TMTC1 isoform X1 [Hydra vulgaris]|uniref:protein O-mannosyl-transferase TMTC1 isoform X1 n=1 Tax=Hydra vulgaris TaxID=6087 RepID=UPI001F5FA61B|nr:protein O-mannosyl-transferase TMTC1 [Hydra vulgaris]XP_047126674.1 protein O-mannosyl-transferase TMTC1 [Hydra vulgaris]